MSARRMRDPVETYREVKAELARRRFRDFIGQFWGVVEPARPLISSWHVDAMADHLQAISEGKIKNLLINVPPAMGNRSSSACCFRPGSGFARSPVRNGGACSLLIMADLPFATRCGAGGCWNHRAIERRSGPPGSWRRIKTRRTTSQTRNRAFASVFRWGATALDSEATPSSSTTP